MAQRPRAFIQVQQLEDRVTPTQGYVPGEVLVGFFGGGQQESLAALTSRNNVVAGTQALGLGQLGIYKVTLQPGVTVDSAIAQLRGLPGLSEIQPNYYHVKTAVPNDPSFQDGTLWGQRNTGQNGGVAGADSRAATGWDVGTGTRSTVVAVIDDGVNILHPDLNPNIWRNPGEIAGDGIDNDGNGLVDDVHGYDFTWDTGDIMFGISDGHGSHVAGTIGAVGNNGRGVAGMAWNTRMMSVPIFSSSPASGTTGVIVSAIVYSAIMGAKISNNSWGGNVFEPILLAAIKFAGEQGQIFVAAAGNDAVDNDVTETYPTNFYNNTDNMVSVAAFNRFDQLADFSSYGSESVTLGAPGVEIYSTVRGGAYDFLDGTSMAAPQVSGALAAYWDATPNATYLEVIDALKRSVRVIPAALDKTDTGGVLDFDALMSLSGSTIYATGAGEGGAPHVKVYRGQGNEIASFYAYDQRFTGGVRVATGDVNGDGVPDVITAAGPTGGPHVKVFDGRTFQEMFSFYAFEPSFRGGLHVAAGDVNGDGRADIIIGAGEGGGPRVSVFSMPVGASGLVRVSDFYAYDPRFGGGVRVAAGVFTPGSNVADIVTAPGRGGGPHVRRFSGASVVAWTPTVVAEAYSGDAADSNGLWVATGDVNGDGVAEITTGSGANMAIVRVHDGRTMAPITVFVNPFSGERPGDLNPGASPPGLIGSLTQPVLNNGLLQPGTNPSMISYEGNQQKPLTIAGYSFGVRVAMRDLNNDGLADLILTGGPNDSPTVAHINGLNFTTMRYFAAYDPAFAGGVYVGSGA